MISLGNAKLSSWTKSLFSMRLLPAYAAIAALAIGIAVELTNWFDLVELFYYLLAVPLIALVLAIAKRSQVILAAFVIYGCISALMFHFGYDVRLRSRWFLGSGPYKAQVLNQPDSLAGELRHIEWDSRGSFFHQSVLYLVFDPANSLSAPARVHASGKFPGLPCEVYRVYQLESHWYAVAFYTDSGWDSCPGRN